MQLLMSPASPFVRKVRVVLHETGQQAEEVEVTASVYDADATIKAANPSGKIPALIRADGPTLYDSRVICRFLDAQAGAGLYPDSRLWEILTLEATGDAIMEAAVLMVYEMRYRSENERSADWVEGQWDKVVRGLSALESRWMPLLQGPLNMGQISVGCALGYLDFRHDARGWRNQAPGLGQWFDKFAERDSMAATKPA